MDQSTLQSVVQTTMDQLRKLSSDYSELEDEYICTRIESGYKHSIINDSPSKLEGVIMFLILKGNVTVEYNMTDQVLTANTLTIVNYNSLIKLKHTGSEKIEAFVLYLSPAFLQKININFSTISAPTLIERKCPVETLTSEEASLMMKYFELLYFNGRAKVNHQLECNIAANLIASVVYQLVQFHYKRIGTPESSTGQRSCRNAYVHDFMKLVHVHFAKERTVAFYADKLCISPKYLSLLVKEATGRSAARWIDDFVIMEAKSLLRFSGKNVQQIAYLLNFSNQSSFGKYFKHLTGMSPTEYQKS